MKADGRPAILYPTWMFLGILDNCGEKMKSIHIVAGTLPEAWEQAVAKCWAEGSEFRTEYDQPGEPSSRDVAAMIHVQQPFAEPRIHRAFPGGLNDLEKYRAEMLYGVHDHWIDPAKNKWEYTYHQRLREYTMPDGTMVDQLAAVLGKLREVSYTRRAQAITYQPWEDHKVYDPPCLQRLWFRVEEGKLNMIAHMRSNDAYKAAFMNMFAFTELQAELAEQLDLAPGEYVHVADSFHIYGSYFQEFSGFLKTLEERSADQRYFQSSFCREFLVDGVDELLAEEDMPEGKKKTLRNRREKLSITKEVE